MKKFITIILCVCMMITLSGCQKKEVDAPMVVTKEFLNAYLKMDVDKIQEYSNWKDYTIKALDIQEGDFVEGVDEKLQQEVFDMMRNFDHSEDKEEITEDSAKVNVTMTIYDFAPVVQEGLKEATAKAEELSKLEDVSDAQAQSQIKTVIFQNLKKAKKTLKKNIVVNLIKKDEQWIVSNDNAQIQNILTTNMKSLQNVGK